jgi:hypothetical protein
MLAVFAVAALEVVAAAGAAGVLLPKAAPDATAAVELTIMLSRSTAITAITAPARSPLLAQRPDAFIVGSIR